MRITSCKLFLLWVLALCGIVAANPSDELQELYEKRQYFDLRDKLAEQKSGSSERYIFYRAVVENKFNRPERSIILINKYLATTASAKDPTNLRAAYTLLADNYVKTYQYAKAANTYERLLTQFAGDLPEQERSSYQNVLGLWKGLAKVAPQTIRINGASAIQGTQERVGLMIPVEVNGHKESFIFDTGANLSTIIESHAQKLGLQIIDTSFDVGSITGRLIKARIGVAKHLNIGNVHLRNVVFIVFPDEALYIEPIKYQITGILGFPPIEALGEISLTRSKELQIHAKPGVIGHGNLCLDGLTPLISGIYEGRRLTFAFDTGARTSSLYPPFFNEFQSNITAVGKSFWATISGAGGSKKVSAYKLENVVMEFAGKKPMFKSIEVLTEQTTLNSRYFYGNLGRDLIEQHDKMTINFASMGISFE